MRDDSDDVRARRFRHEVELDAEVHYPDGHTSKARLTNLSLEGCRLAGWFRIGDRLEFTIPNIGRVRGQVRWAVGGHAGIRFIASSETDEPVV